MAQALANISFEKSASEELYTMFAELSSYPGYFREPQWFSLCYAWFQTYFNSSPPGWTTVNLVVLAAVKFVWMLQGDWLSPGQREPEVRCWTTIFALSDFRDSLVIRKPDKHKRVNPERDFCVLYIFFFHKTFRFLLSLVFFISLLLLLSLSLLSLMFFVFFLSLWIVVFVLVCVSAGWFRLLCN